jgi:hypothetical protein
VHNASGGGGGGASSLDMSMGEQTRLLLETSDGTVSEGEPWSTSSSDMSLPSFLLMDVVVLRLMSPAPSLVVHDHDHTAMDVSRDDSTVMKGTARPREVRQATSAVADVCSAK